MASIEYDPRLVESAVNHAVRAAAAEREFRRSLDPAYAESDLDRRDALFQEIYARWFVRLKLDAPVSDWLGQFPSTAACVQKVVVRLAINARKQFAELLRDDAGPEPKWTLMVRVCPDSLCSPAGVQEFFFRELAQVADMLDPRFGYSPLDVNIQDAAGQLVRDRYCVLWSMRTEKRLACAGKLRSPDKQRLRMLFCRTFSSGDAADETFDRIWQLDAAGHRQLLAWAANPQLLKNAACGLTATG